MQKKLQGESALGSTNNYNVITLYRIKNEEEFIERSIKSCIGFSDKIIIFDDHSTDRTKEICLGFGEKIDYIDSPFEETTDEVRDKNYLLDYAHKFNPKWFMCLDADEELQQGGDVTLQKLIDRMNKAPEPPPMVHFKFLYLWNKNFDVRVDGLYNRFVSPRLWHITEKTKEYRYIHYGSKCGFHCGWVPNQVQAPVKFMSKVHILHWGNHNEEIRRRKYVWYNIKDPNNFACEDRYRHIVGAGDGYMHAGHKIQLYPLQSILEDSL